MDPSTTYQRDGGLARFDRTMGCSKQLATGQIAEVEQDVWRKRELISKEKTVWEGSSHAFIVASWTLNYSGLARWQPIFETNT